MENITMAGNSDILKKPMAADYASVLYAGKGKKNRTDCSEP